VEKILQKAKENDVKVHLPVDTVIADEFDDRANSDHCDVYEIPDGWLGMDIGFKSREKFKNIILSSSTILWNGPMGVFEMPSFV
ncbi:MAG: phosphoglycerate kinase, partial [Flavobacteriales bacterium]